MPSIAKYRGPWQGVDSSKPANIIDPSAAEFIENFILRNGEIRTRPVLNPLQLSRTNPMAGVAPGNTASTDVSANTGTIKILDQQTDPGNGTFYPYLIDDKTAWAFDFTTQAWKKIADMAELVNNAGTTTPVTSVNINGLIYFCTFAGGKLYQMNVPTQAMPGNPASAIAGGLFLGELAAHLILVGCVEGGTFISQRVRWSASGSPTQLDPTVDPTAGFNDLLDVPDTLTGFVTLGKTGYVFRSNGITEMIPTGNAALPFDFVHISNANNAGIGGYYPLSIDSWGSYCCFLSSDDVYMITGNGIQSIGGKAADAIFADIADFTNAVSFAGPGSPLVDVVGSILPMMRRTYTYPMYILTIPTFRAANVTTGTTSKVVNTTIFWIYSIRDQSWTRWVSNQGVVVSGLNFLGASKAANNCPEKTQFVMVPQFLNTGKSYAGFFALDTDPTNTGSNLSNISYNTEEDATYRFKIEEIDTDKKPTVRKVRILYRNLGTAKITVVVECQDGTKDLPQDVVIGDSTANNKIKVAYANVFLTGMLPQVVITRKADSGPVSIIGVDLVGEVMEPDKL